MISRDSDNFINQVRSDMRLSMKDRNLAKVNALKNLLARISAAEAVNVDDEGADINSQIAGASRGVGSTELARKNLTLHELKGLANEEIAEIRQTISQLGPSQYRDSLVAQVDILLPYAK